jgi:pimeloyl-ACP methyl ester carboxylesterase
MGERFERALLVRKDVPGVLVALSEGTPGHGLGVTVHGINASAADIAPLTEELVRSGAATLTFLYDDNYRRQGNSAADLAAAVRPQLAAHPREPLRVWAHSMGARVALVAIEKLAHDGALGDRDVTLELVAPPLGGFFSANLTRLTLFGFPLLLEFKNARPSLDMATFSGFQRRIESLSLPDNVSVRVFLASHDGLADENHARLRRVLERLRAEVVRLPNTTHASVVAAAADWLAGL